MLDWGTNEIVEDLPRQLKNSIPVVQNQRNLYMGYQLPLRGRIGFGRSRHTKGPLLKINLSAKTGASVASLMARTHPQSCPTTKTRGVELFRFAPGPFTPPSPPVDMYISLIPTINSTNGSRTSSGLYTSAESLPPYPGRSTATTVAFSATGLDLRMCRQMKQLSGHP